MKYSVYKTLAVTLLSCGLVAACSSDDDGDEGDTATLGDGVFVFSTAQVAEFTRVDRIGMPAIATALIASKDSYNIADPSAELDATSSAFTGEILTSLDTLHTALDDDLASLSITPCTVVGDGTGTCAATAVPLILPDTLKIDATAAAGFPNGRMLEDPVIDVTLAVALIELTGDTAQTPTSLVGALNPTANDVAFKTAFPCLADPN